MKTVSKENTECWTGQSVGVNIFRPLWAAWVCLAINHTWRIHLFWDSLQRAHVTCDRCQMSIGVIGDFEVGERVLLEARRIDWIALAFSVGFVVLIAIAIAVVLT